jgi:hypothetical protein
MIAVHKNVPTATNDLMLSLAIPQSPWPLVQPLLNLVPNPTNSPANANPGYVVHWAIYCSGPKG